MPSENDKDNSTPRRSTRIASKKANRMEIVIDLTSPSPKKFFRAGNEETPSKTNSSPSPGEIESHLDEALEAAEALSQCLKHTLSNGVAVDIHRLQKIAQDMKQMAQHLKSGGTRCTSDTPKESSESESEDNCSDEHSSCASYSPDEDSLCSEEEADSDDASSLGSVRMENASNSFSSSTPPPKRNGESKPSNGNEGGQKASSGTTQSDSGSPNQSEFDSSTSHQHNTPMGAPSAAMSPPQSSTRTDASSSGPGFTQSESKGSREGAVPKAAFDKSHEPADGTSSTANVTSSPKPAFSQQKQTPKPPFFYEEDKENVPNCNSEGCRGVGSARGFQSSQPSILTPTKTKPQAKLAKKFTTEEQQEFTEKVLCANESGNGSHYKVLGLSTNATNEDIKKAYHALSKKAHPDKNQAPKAADGFRAVRSAYEVLYSPTKRSAYNSRCNISSDTTSVSNSANNSSSQNNSSDQYAPGSSQFNTIPAGTHVIIQSSVSPLCGQNGSVQSFNTQAGKYRVRTEDETNVEVEPSFLLQSISVRVRASHRLARLHGVHSVTLVSKMSDNYYRASYTLGGAQHLVGLFGLFDTSNNVVIPNGTIVRLKGLENKAGYNGRYGKVVNWVERIDECESDTSYYDVQMTSTDIVRVKMMNVCL